MNTRVHISIEVADIKKSVEFYSRLFQTQPTKVRSDYANFRLDTPQLHLALVHTPGRMQEPHSNRHYGIELFTADKLNIWRKAAEESGIGLRLEEQTTCCYAVADKFWARDPDGHEWEFWVRHAEASTMHGEAAEACRTDDSRCCAPVPQLVSEEKTHCCAPGVC